MEWTSRQTPPRRRVKRLGGPVSLRPLPAAPPPPAEAWAAAYRGLYGERGAPPGGAYHGQLLQHNVHKLQQNARKIHQNHYEYLPRPGPVRHGYSSYSDDSSAVSSSSSLSTTAWSTDSSMADDDDDDDFFADDHRFPVPFPVGAYDVDRKSRRAPRRPELWESAELSSVDYSATFHLPATLTSTPCDPAARSQRRSDADGNSLSHHGYGYGHVRHGHDHVQVRPCGQGDCQGHCSVQGQRGQVQGHYGTVQGHYGTVQGQVYGRQQGDYYSVRDLKLEGERRGQPEGRSRVQRGMSSMAVNQGSDVSSFLTASPLHVGRQVVKRGVLHGSRGVLPGSRGVLYSRPAPCPAPRPPSPDRSNPTRHFPRHSTPQRLPPHLTANHLPRRATPPGACDVSDDCHDVTASSIRSESGYSSFPEAPANSYVSGGSSGPQEGEDCDDDDVTLGEDEITLDESEMSALDEAEYEQLRHLERGLEMGLERGLERGLQRVEDARGACDGQETRLTSGYDDAQVSRSRHAPVMTSHDITAFSVAASDATDFMERPLCRKPVTHRAPAQHQRRKLIARCLRKMGRRLKLSSKNGSSESPLKTLALL